MAARTSGAPWLSVAVVIALGAVLTVAVLLGVRGALIGETLVSGDDWRIVARWSPFGSSVTYEDPDSSGGAGGLASPGLLSESMGFRPSEGSATYVVGVLPAGADTVRAAADGSGASDVALERVLGDVFYTVRIEGAGDEVVLEAIADDGRVVGTHTRPMLVPDT